MTGCLPAGRKTLNDIRPGGANRVEAAHEAYGLAGSRRVRDLEASDARRPLRRRSSHGERRGRFKDACRTPTPAPTIEV